MLPVGVPERATRAESWARRSGREFRRYVAGLPGVGDMVESLDRLVHHVGREWRTLSHRESYVMARKVMMWKPELREEAPASLAIHHPRTQQAADHGIVTGPLSSSIPTTGGRRARRIGCCSGEVARAPTSRRSLPEMSLPMRAVVRHFGHTSGQGASCCHTRA